MQRISRELTFASELEKFRFESLQNKFSGAWLTATPNPNLGTLLNNDTIRTCVGLRLGANICRPHYCDLCSSLVDSLGRHGLCCKNSKGKYPRHLVMNRILQQSLSTINTSSRLEPPGMFRHDGKRVDGVTNIPWSKGRALVWDVTCVDTLAKSYLRVNNVPGQASENAAKKKHRLYEEIKRNYHFVAFAVETIGPWAAETIKLIETIGRKLIEISGDKRSRQFFIQRLSTAIQRGNYECILGTLPKSDSLNEIFYI